MGHPKKMFHGMCGMCWDDPNWNENAWQNSAALDQTAPDQSLYCLPYPSQH